MTNTENTKAPFVVCPECRGEGHFGPGFVWTSAEIEQEDPEEFEDMQRALRGGQFDVPCETCKGARVVRAHDEDGYTAEQAWRDECEWRAEAAAERRMGC